MVTDSNMSNYESTGGPDHMKKRYIQLFVIICCCFFLTACSEGTEEAADRAADGVSGSTVTGVVTSAAVSGTSVSLEKIPMEMSVSGREDEEAAVTFFVKERTEEGYRARVRVEGWYAAHPEWELCLGLEDEITEIKGAEIASREGNLYTIQGTLTETIFGDIDDEDYLIWFDIAVACPDGAHDPGICYWKREFESCPLPDKDYKVEELKREIKGRKVRLKLRLTNCSGKRMDRWTLGFITTFDIKSISGAEICFQYEWEEGDYSLCGEKGNRSLEKGESIDITMTGKCYDKGESAWYRATEVETAKETEVDWGRYGQACRAKYGKADKYLVADSVRGVDLFFVFDKKRKDSYTATVEMTNILRERDVDPQREREPGADEKTILEIAGQAGVDEKTILEIADWVELDEKTMLEIADWEICLECEDTIEEIEGAEIVSHEGNNYYIRATDKDKWISKFGMETFQVNVSYQGKIHQLGKAYLTKVRYRGENISSGEKQQELVMPENSSLYASGLIWYTYKQMYGTYRYDSDYFDSAREYKAYKERVKWGKKMGR